MRGGFLHSQVMVGRLVDCLRRRGERVETERPAGPGRAAGYVDVFAQVGRRRIVCEAELSAARVEKDLAKALALEADLLLIVTPERRTAERIRRRLKGLGPSAAPAGTEIVVAPLGPAIQRLTEIMSISDSRECPQDINTNKPQIRPSIGRRGDCQ